MKRSHLVILCAVALWITLALGLWPFHAPRNKVTWLENGHGLRFSRYSTVFGADPLPIAPSPHATEGSLEIWLQPLSIWYSNTFLAFYTPSNPFQFSLRQSQTDLLLQTVRPDSSWHKKADQLYVEGIFRQKPTFLTITSGTPGLCVYIDGVLAKAAPGFRLSAEDFSGKLVVGDSPGQGDSWAGELLGLAIYNRELTAPEVSHNYLAWQQNRRPAIRSVAALYLFDEHMGNTVRDKGEAGVDLHIPEKYEVLDHIFLEPFWTEFSMSGSYWRAALKNIVGFIPLGFCFYAYGITILPVKRAAFVTVVLGTAVSLTIEILQFYLPTRDSGTTDLITNTLGTWIGVASYDLLSPILIRFFPHARKASTTAG